MRAEDSRDMELKSSDVEVLSRAEKLQLLHIARDAMTAIVNDRDYSDSRPNNKNLTNRAGAFVTIKKHGELRGCIGIIEPRFPLYQVVAEMAEKAALCDPRFEPLRKEELDELDLEISVLSPPKEIENIEKIEVGHHGLIVERSFHKGLLLPQVAIENNWNREEFLEYTCMKAGLAKDSYQFPDIHLFIFTASVFGEREFGIGSGENFARRE